MKKFNIRKQIAALLSASMVFAMLAPALTAYAAPNPIIFLSIGILKSFFKRLLFFTGKKISLSMILGITVHS